MDLSVLWDLLQKNTVAGLVIVICWLFYRSENKKWNDLVSQLRDERQQLFVHLKDLTDTIAVYGATVYRIENKIDTGQYCPYFKSMLKGEHHQ